MDTTLDDIARALDGRYSARSTIEENYIAGRHRPVFVPPEATNEYRALSRKAIANYVGGFVRAVLQDLAITGYRNPANAEAATVTWQSWVAGQMQAGRSKLAVRHAAVHGASYLALIPDPKTMSWVTGVFAPSQVYVRYDDPVNDPRPLIFACRVPGAPGLAVVWEDKVPRLFDLKSKTYAGKPGVTAPLRFRDTEPVVRQTMGDWVMSASGGDLVPSGLVSPLLAPQDRVNQAIMDLMLVQTYGAVMLRGFAGLDVPEGDEEQRKLKIEVGADRVHLFDDEDVKALSIPGTPLEPFIRNVDAAIGDFIRLSQASPTRYMNKIENVGNDAILTAREAYEALLASSRVELGERFELFARALTVAQDGEDPGPDGYMTWRSTELRTIAELADAVPKLNSVGLNVEPLIRRSLPWKVEEQDELMDGYQRGRTEPSPDTRALVGDLRRQRNQLAEVPDQATQTGAGV